MPTLSPTVKKLLSVAFFAALIFGGAQIFKVESAETEIHLKWRDSARRAELRSVDLRLFEVGDDEVLGHFRAYPQGERGEDIGRWKLTLSPGHYRLEGEVELASGLEMVSTELSLEDGKSHSVYLAELLH